MSIDVELDDDGVATITINRPERMNALDDDHYRGLSAAWERVRDDHDVRVAIVTGAGNRAFTAGADLSGRVEPEPHEFWLTQRDQLLNRGLEVWKPVVAAVNGHCLGGGMTLLLATDLRVAADHATFGLPEVRRGLIPANGGTQRLLEQLPHAVAMEVLLTGEPIDADTALRWGLLNAVVPETDVLVTARRYALRVAANAPLAVQAAKEAALRARGMSRADGLRLEQAMQRALRQTDDAREGAAAFVEKRPPVFRGR
jgi:E-phenylitaconyl-CoA hydratase